jgi:sulfatase modifying factor 1
MHRFRTLCVVRLGVAIASLLCGCRSTLGLSQPLAQLHILNPARLPLRLAAIDGERRMMISDLGAAPTYTLTLASGAYVVHARGPHGEFALPAPLFANALPSDATLELRVAPPPTCADPEFAVVPAGPALVGDTLGIGQEDERPARIVEVAAFALGRREVTNAEFAAFLNAMDNRVDEAWCAFDSRKFRCRRDAGAWRTDAPALPVVTVSLGGARAYCDWRTNTTGVRHRLPREVEWEKAARGPESLVYAYGNVYRRDAANQESGTLRDVAQFAANGYGLHDMTGNAFEWTEDAYVAPGAAAAEFQVLRGGSFVLDGMYLRNSFRMRQRPDVRTDDIGFRVVREIAEKDSDR